VRFHVPVRQVLEEAAVAVVAVAAACTEVAAGTAVLLFNTGVEPAEAAEVGVDEVQAVRVSAAASMSASATNKGF
jgi:hypothetical protein